MNRDPLTQTGARWPRIILMGTVSAALLALLFSRYDAASVAAVVGSGLASGWILLALMISVLVNILLPAEKLRRILGALGRRVPWSPLLYLNLAADIVVTVMPLRTGELVKPWYLSRRHGVPAAVGAGSVLIDISLNLAALLLLALAGWIGLALGSLAAGIAAGAASAALFLLLAGPLGRSSLRFLPQGDGEAETVRGQILLALRNVAAIPPGRLALVFCYSLIAEIGEIVNVALIFRAFSAEVEFIHLLAYLPLVAVVARLPISLSGLGVRESLVIVAFGGAAGALHADLLGIGLLYSFVQSLFPTLAGLPLTLHLLATYPGRRKSDRHE